MHVASMEIEGNLLQPMPTQFSDGVPCCCFLAHQCGFLSRHCFPSSHCPGIGCPFTGWCALSLLASASL